jgi:hypothetical protein
MDSFINIFQPKHHNHFPIFVKTFCLSLIVIILWHFKDQYAYLKTRPTKIYGKHQAFLNLYFLKSPKPIFYIIFGICLILSLVAVFLGINPSLFSFFCFLLYFPYFNSVQSLDYIQRKTNLLPFVFLIFVFSSAIHLKTNAQSGIWEIILIKTLLIQIYLSAGINKLKKGGLEWINGSNLQAYLLENYLWYEIPITLKIAQKKAFCSFFSILVLLFELTFIIIIFIPNLTFYFVIFGALFHFSTMILMRINYLKFLSPVYLIFFCDLPIWSKLI